MIPGVRVCALGLHRGSQHHAVHGHIHLPQGLFHLGCPGPTLEDVPFVSEGRDLALSEARKCF